MASKIETISVPEIYTTSSDFRFFLKWFEYCLTKTEYDTENLDDIYDPLRCPSELIWMLADTMGFKYDDRLPAAFNRLVLVYFMSMIRNKGSKDGVTLAAEANLAQFNIAEYGKENPILFNRLEDTSIPVNSVYVTPHVREGYIDVVYFSEETPVDACIEYVRPLGMYLAQAAGVRYDARTKISIDPRLTDIVNIGMSIGPTHVGHYSREDYARMQVLSDSDLTEDPNSDATYIDDIRYSYDYDPSIRLTRRQAYQAEQKKKLSHARQPAWYRNSKYEGDPTIDANYRALYSLQMSNNEHIFNSLLPGLDDETLEELNRMSKIFGLGYNPQDTQYTVADDYVMPSVANDEIEYQYTNGNSYKNWNLRYDKTADSNFGGDARSLEDLYTSESDGKSPLTVPAINPVMGSVGDAISINKSNTQYIMADESGEDINYNIYPVTDRTTLADEPIANVEDVITDWVEE